MSTTEGVPFLTFCEMAVDKAAAQPRRRGSLHDAVGEALLLEVGGQYFDEDDDDSYKKLKYKFLLCVGEVMKAISNPEWDRFVADEQFTFIAILERMDPAQDYDRQLGDTRKILEGYKRQQREACFNHVCWGEDAFFGNTESRFPE